MNAQTAEIYKTILDEDFTFKDWNMEQFISIGMECVEVKSLNQRLLGRLANGLEAKYGQQTIANFAKEVGVSPNSMYVYKEVEKKLEHLDIPDDYHWSARRWLADSGNPKQYLQKALDEGLSPSQLIRIIKHDLGKTRKELECPNCHTVISHLECPKCKTVIKRK